MTTPLISIIIPNYNHASFLRQRIDSILNQTFSDFELIILDDASNDNSVEIINEYKNNPKISRIELNQTNGGKAVLQWKKGIDMAKGDWIWIAESDDYCEPVFLEKLLEFSNQNPNCGIIYCQSEDVNSNGKKIRSRIDYTSEIDPNIWQQNFVLKGTEFIKTGLKVKNVIPNASAVIFKRSVVLSEKVFNSLILTMRYASDWFFWILLMKNTYVGFVSETYNYFREHSATTRIHDTNEKINDRVADEIIIRRYLEKYYPEIEQENEWELIYSKWFSLQNNFPFFNSRFYFPKKRNLNFVNYIQKFNQFKNRKRL